MSELPRRHCSYFEIGSDMTKCLFNECSNTAEPHSVKCKFHRSRSKCVEANCLNQAYARGRCVRHGAKKRCIVEACAQNRRFGGFCSKHAQNHRKKKCGVDGCERQPHAKGKCVRHGGGRFCKTEGCTAHARIGAFCARHADKDSQRKKANLEPITAQKLEAPDELDLAILNDLTRDIDYMTPPFNYISTSSPISEICGGFKLDLTMQ
ncbi:hypothetical protein AeRB84_010662 [Aphanomyces euteiches]|nr:hypothetical protein AeRB84_010662 [Aphanomyces euteiches]